MSTPPKTATAVETAAVIPSLSDFVVLKRADVDRLLAAVGDLWDSSSNDGCEEPYFVGDQTHLDAVRQLSGQMREAKSLDQALRRVDGDPDQRNDPILVVVPQGLDDVAAVQAMDQAIDAANQKSGFGRDGAYFDALQEALSAHGVAINQGIELLRSQPWDADLCHGCPDLDDASGDYLTVEFRICHDDPGAIEPVGLLVRGDEADESTAVEPIDDVPFQGFCTAFEVTYPRADRYGVPDCATHSGAVDFIRQITTLRLHPGFEVNATDSRDDTAMSFSVRALVHKDCVRVVEQDTHRQREGEQ